MTPSTRMMAMDALQTTSQVHRMHATSTQAKRRGLRLRQDGRAVDDQLGSQGTQPRRALRTK